MLQQQPSQQQISHHKALSHFDAAVTDLHITYSPSIPIPLTDNGFDFQFRVCPQFLNKPQLPPDDSTPDPTKSDISQPLSLHIADVAPAHSLKINAFPTLRPSYLLLTTSPLHHQNSPLSLDDITAARTTLASLSDDRSAETREGESKESHDYMMMYNSGRAAGCSRFHKHMQILPCAHVDSFSLFPDHPPGNVANVPYVYDLIRHPVSPSSSLSDNPNTSTYVFASYNSSLDRFRALLGTLTKDQPVPHNVLMTREWTVVIPRTRGQSNGLSANAAGMMGLVWVRTEGEIEKWKQDGPWRVLEALGLKSESKTL
ncbi:MAG: hypothetical protein M1812_002360 [Candelaria pacifica]|nr:MAG: hypothetical protein M1812_002360 [Candelaria pacifica]